MLPCVAVNLAADLAKYRAESVQGRPDEAPFSPLVQGRVIRRSILDPTEGIEIAVRATYSVGRTLLLSLFRSPLRPPYSRSSPSISRSL